MITCPKCGAANQDRSRFCGECGTALAPPAGRRCPMCGVMNPSGNATCSSCGARLIPLVAPASEEAKPAESPPTAPGASDDWLSSLRRTLPEQPAPGTDVSDRQRDVESAPAEEPPTFDLASRLGGAATPPPPPAAIEVPDWLKQMAQPKAAPASFTSGEVEVPDWLKQLESTSKPGAPPSPAPAEPLAEAEVPEWLKQITSTPKPSEPPPPPSPAAPSPAEVESAGPESAEMPEWLKGLTPADLSGPGASPALTGEQMPAPETPAGLSGWLKELESPTAPTSEAAIPPAPPLPPPPGEMPEWLKELRPTQAAAPAPSALTEAPAPAPAPGESGVEAAKLPSWLQTLAPKEPSSEAIPQAVQEPAETEGILAGLHGVLPVAAIAAQTLGAGVSMRPRMEADELARAGALQELIAHGAMATIQRGGESRAQKLWGNTQRWIVFLIVAVVAVVPLVYNLGLVNTPQLSTAGSDLYGQIDTLKPDVTVLVAFDYDATQSPEMDTLAGVLMSHLFTRQVSVTVISLYPAGPAAAQAVISQVTDSMSGTTPIKYINLGYVPGQVTAVALYSAKPYSSVVELAATPETLRWWAEQLSTRTDAPPLLAGVSASAEPMSQPYVESKQVKGMIAGVPGAIAYRLKLQGVLSASERAPVESIGVANVTLVGLIILGGLIQLLSGRGSPSGAERRSR